MGEMLLLLLMLLHSPIRGLSNDARTFQLPFASKAVSEEIPALPAGPVHIMVHHDLEVALSRDVDALQRCETISPNSTSAMVHAEKRPNCQRVLKDITDNGTWTIRAIAHDNVTVYARMELFVHDYPATTSFRIVLVAGEDRTLLFGPENATFCQFVDPRRQMNGIHHGRCSVRLEKVTKEHEGLWKARVGVTGAMMTLNYTYDVVVQELGFERQRIVTYLNSTENEVRMSCKILSDSVPKCRMIRPDGEVLILNEGIGFENYEYFITGGGNTIVKECGVKINKPKSHDIGAWKCVFVHDDGKTEGSWIDNRINETLAIDFVNQSTALSVVKDKPFEMFCEYSSPIEYCWFRSPNNTNYFLTQSTSNDIYEYIGEGYELGQCGIRIKSPSRTDAGNWRCSVGPKKQVAYDKWTRIRVNYIDSPFRSTNKEYFWQERMRVRCSMYNNAPLEYCRFVTPEGYGLNPTQTNNDIYNGEGTDLKNGICQMIFIRLSIGDLGRWTCMAKPANEDAEYVNEFFIYTYYWGHHSSVSLTLFYCTLGVLGAFGLFVLVKLFYKHRGEFSGEQRNRTPEPPTDIRPSNSPPPYSAVPSLTTPSQIKIDEV